MSLSGIIKPVFSGSSGGITPVSFRSYENINTLIYEYTKLELQRTWKSLDHKLSSGNMT